MNEKRIVIDAGHGGTDVGAVGNGLQEKDLTLKISKYMLDVFNKMGIPATLTRTTDETVVPAERVRRILSAYGNDPNVIVISNHINSSQNPNTAEGAEVIFALRNKDTLARNILEGIGREGQVTRSYFQRRLPSNPALDYYFIHRDTGVTEPVIVEYGFINNTNDIRRVQENYKNYVDAVVRAVINTFDIDTGRYIVQKGDTLYGIAQRFNTTVEYLKDINNLTSDVLTEGQILRVPHSESNTGLNMEYIVERGDSLWSIAQRFNTTVDELKRVNNLTTNVLSIGQVLRIPQENDNMTEETTTIYTVQMGDSLWSIAQKFNTTVEELKRINNLSNNIILIGQELLINTPSTHTVNPGDTLWSIAQKHNTTVEYLKEKNNLTSDVLFVGQILEL